MSANLANILGITKSDIMFKDEKEIMERRFLTPKTKSQ